MHLVHILLPLYDRTGARFDSALFDQVAAELTARFGGLTAYARSPAIGLWSARTGHTMRDDVVVYEVMVDGLDKRWWADYRAVLEARFAQDELVIRAQLIERL